MVRLIGLAAILFLSLGLIGCASPGASPTTGPTDPLTVRIVHDEATIQESAQIATTVVLLSLKEPDRTSFGEFAFTASQAINTAIDSNNVNLSGVQSLAQDLIAKSNLPHKEEVGLLLNSLATLVESRLKADVFKDLPDDSKLAATRAFLRGATAGVMSATAAYAPPAKTSMLIDPVKPENAMYWDFQPKHYRSYG